MLNGAATGRGASRLLIPDNAHLTAGELPHLELIRRRTWAGQASWATGPHYCGNCAFWNDAGGKHGKSKQARACAEYLKLMGRRGPRVPADALACRFFQLNGEERQRRELAATF
jgi:hypothetical protein